MQITMPERYIEIFKQALRALNSSGAHYAVGGAFAVHYYSKLWRNTNDLDVYIEREDLPEAIDALLGAGFHDFGEMAAGDRGWIYHAMKDNTLVDVIWQLPNYISPINSKTFLNGPKDIFFDIPVQFLPPHELMWTKIFTMNHQRCDWPDIFGIVRAHPESLDWNYLADKMSNNWPVLLSFIVLYDWVYPGDSYCIPQSIREKLLLRKQQQPMSTASEHNRELMLDPWIYTRPISP